MYDESKFNSDNYSFFRIDDESNGEDDPGQQYAESWYDTAYCYEKSQTSRNDDYSSLKGYPNFEHNSRTKNSESYIYDNKTLDFNQTEIVEAWDRNKFDPNA